MSCSRRKRCGLRVGAVRHGRRFEHVVVRTCRGRGTRDAQSMPGSELILDVHAGSSNDEKL